MGAGWAATPSTRRTVRSSGQSTARRGRKPPSSSPRRWPTARGIVYDAGKQTVGEYLTRWLSDSVKDTVRWRTYERYESIVRVHLVPVIGRIKLKALTPAHVRGLYRQKLDSGLSPRSVLHIHRTLYSALKQAVSDGLIPRNAAASVKPPQPRREECGP